MTGYTLKRHLAMRGMRTRREVWRGILKTAKDGVVLIALLLGLLYAVNWFTVEAVADELRTAKNHVEDTWISCLQNRGVYINGELHLCSLANVWFNKNQKHLEDTK